MKRWAILWVWGLYLAAQSSYQQEAETWIQRLDSLVYWQQIEERFLAPQKALLETPVKTPYDPTISPEMLEERLKALESVIPLEVNPMVQAFIKVYIEKYPDLTAKLLGRSVLFFPYIEEVFDREGLPLELKYMAVIESALVPTARSPAGAVGLWQFVYPTARYYGLKITSYIDERRDPFKSTVAAAKYLKRLYSIYKDWLLVIAAYNCGPGNVNRAIKKAGGKRNVWELMPYLPRETRGYVPAFIAAYYAMEYAKEHGIYPEPVHYTFYTDTIHILRKKVSLRYLAKIMGVDEKLLRLLNPELRRGVVPYTTYPYVLRIPSEAFTAFYYNRHLLNAPEATIETEAEIDSSNLAYVILPPPNTEIHFHEVQEEETIEDIAHLYEVAVDSIKKWNRLYDERLRPGTYLKIFIPLPEESASDSIQKPKFLYYRVRREDTLWSIQQRFPHISIEQLRAINQLHPNQDLKEGQWLKIPIH